MAGAVTADTQHEDARALLSFIIGVCKRASLADLEIFNVKSHLAFLSGIGTIHSRCPRAFLGFGREGLDDNASVFSRRAGVEG